VFPFLAIYRKSCDIEMPFATENSPLRLAIFLAILGEISGEISGKIPSFLPSFAGYFSFKAAAAGGAS
jgi:hypothetical protein